MLKVQIMTITALAAMAERLRSQLEPPLRGERGEITSTVAIIGVLVVGALAAGAIVVARMQAHANAIPDPGG